MPDASAESQVAKHDAHTRLRLLALATALGVLLALMILSIMMAVAEAGFNHLSCKISDDTLGTALTHARSLVENLQGNRAFLATNNNGETYLNIDALKEYLSSQERSEPATLYAMIASKRGNVFLHTAGKTDGLHVWGGRDASIPTQGSFAEFPNGRLGFKEFVYEVRAPFTIAPWQDFVLVIGLSKARISEHIDDVRRGMVAWMLTAAGVGLACLALPIAGLWLVIRRYRIVMAHSRKLAQLAQLGELSKGLAHEIRNPLNAVRFNLKIIEEESERFPDDSREGCRQLLRRVTGEIERVDEMLSKYLSYVRPAPCVKSEQDLNALVQQAIDLVAPACKDKGIHICGELSQGLPALAIDEKQIYQAILNVIVNAQQALSSMGGGKIVARTRLAGDMVVLEIEDNGAGVSVEEREAVFQPFFSKKEGGTGLGLALTRRIMESHGGSIECLGEPHRQGAVFVLKLPVSRKAAKEALEA